MSRVEGPAPPLRRRVATPLALALAALLALAATAAPLPAQAPAQDVAVEAHPATTITAETMRAHVEALAHDSMRGRDTPSPELLQAAEYVAEHFRQHGVRSGLGDEGYQQWYPLTVVQPAVAADQRATIRNPAGEELSLESGGDFVPAPTGADVSGQGQLRVWRPGHGNAGEGVLAVRVTPDDIGMTLPQVRDQLDREGTVGALVVLDEAPRSYFFGLRSFFRSEQLYLGEPGDTDRPVVLARMAALPDEIQGALREGRTLPEGWTAELATRADVRAEQAPNTIGWIPGSDPDLRNEYVVLLAHKDHLGVGAPVNGDSIYNGADDNASGTAAVLELARAFASAEEPPRRSLVFMTVSGEEKGLLGSEWYSDHPVFPLDRTVAAINLDMIGRNWQDTVVAIGQDESTLGETVQRVARERGDELNMEVIDDPWPEQRFYYRSDHYNFARRGVPILFFFTGVHDDYHQPSDRPEALKYGKTSRIVQLVYHVTEEIANADQRPEWDETAYERVVEDPAGR